MVADNPSTDPNLNTTSKFKATLRVDCLVGNPPADLEEGIHGFTLFVATED
jgi:hypothetical protein